MRPYEPVGRESDGHLVADPECRRNEGLVPDMKVVERSAQDRESIRPRHGPSLLNERH